MKDYDKNKELSFNKYLDVTNLYGLVIPKALPVDGFMWAEKISI